MSRAILRFLIPVLLVGAALAFTLALAPYASSLPDAGSKAAVFAAATKSPASPPQTPTPTPTPESEPGSTDGIVVMSFVIVVVVVVPILLQRSLWMK